MAFELQARECCTALRHFRTTSHHHARLGLLRHGARWLQSRRRAIQATFNFRPATSAPKTTPRQAPGSRRSARAANSEGLTRKSCTCKGRPPSYGALLYGTAKRRPQHGTKHDTDIRLIPPYGKRPRQLHGTCAQLDQLDRNIRARAQCLVTR